MYRIELTAKEKESLQSTFKSTDDYRLRDRCQAVLMASRQRVRKQIAQDLEIDTRTLTRWLEAYRRGGLEGLKIQWAPGAKGLIPKELAPEIIEWVKLGPVDCGLDRANWTYEELATYLHHKKGIKVGRTTMRVFCAKHNIRPYKPTYDYRKADPQAQEKAKKKLEEIKKKAQNQELILLSQDEVKFSMVPTLQKTLGLKGHRLIVGNDDNKDNVYMFGSLNLVSGDLTTNLLEWPKNKKQRKSSLQQTFIKHLEQVAKKYPAKKYPEVVLTIDNASWHQGEQLNKLLKKHTHLKLFRLPPYSPKLQVIERFWKILRRRATHNRFFISMTHMRKAIRNSICYYQTIKQRILSLIESPRKRTKSPTA
ncbi:MAG: IS630 family transposase [Candidatus Marinimicrobia bacterium]|nr:IS630 family transposase [Candidatus Neomarinimicrobiota bacterium]